ncbi:aromatic acid/H+ symport family MFS transporter [Arthrobacter methylotrophus]|uniref:MFS transporter n=1 Tax=Arthrobacter methylotrophus TaxID=121291 RepID=A0ABV5UNI5_9MICC
MKNLNLTQHVQEARFNRFHLMIAAVGFLLIMCDGYDVAVFGTITPPLMAAWKLTPVAAGAIGSSGLVGMLFGAIGFGALADRLGRKRVVLVTVLLYSVFTALCGFAQEPTFFTVCRVIAGLGLGGIMPNVIALLADFSPKRLTATITTIVLCGFAVGGLLAPLLGILVIPTAGWQVSLWVAAIPLLFLPWMYKALPESISVLMKRGNREEIAKLLERIDPSQTIDRDIEFTTESPSKAKLPLTDLFNNNRAMSTLMFWLAFFAHLLMAYGILNWLPKLMIESGFSLASSLAFLVIWQLGGIIGTIVAGRMADRLGAKKIVIALYITGTIVIAGVGVSTNALLSYVLVGIAGATITGVQNLVQVYIAEYYPAFVRSTALGSASGMGRIGAILGPILGGLLLSFSLSSQGIFFVFAIPGLIAAFAIAMVSDKKSHQRQLENAAIQTPLQSSDGKQLNSL